jgi:hypothetical protein
MASNFSASSHEIITAPGNRREIARLAALLEVLDQFVDFLADDLALIRLFTRRDAAFQQIPADLGLPGAAAHARAAAALIAVAQHFEPHELVDVFGSQGSLIELHAKLLHSKCGDTDHRYSETLS